MTYTNLTILPLVAAVRLKQRLGGHQESQEEISIPPAPVNAALSGMLALEAAALRVVNMPIGSSLLAGSRRSQWKPPLPVPSLVDCDSENPQGQVTLVALAVAAGHEESEVSSMTRPSAARGDRRAGRSTGRNR